MARLKPARRLCRATPVARCVRDVLRLLSVQIAFDEDDVGREFGADPDPLVDAGLFPSVVPDPAVAGEFGPTSDPVPLDIEIEPTMGTGGPGKK